MPQPTYDAIIIGAGLAGSSAAVHLARRGRCVLLLEKRRLPASKLCGEFLSPEVTASFGKLGVLGAVYAAGAHRITRAVMTAPGGARFMGRLPGTALGLSRLRLDKILFDRAREAGAEARDGTSVRAVEGALGEGFCVQATDGEAFHGRIILGAYGKRGVLDRALGRPFLQENSGLVAFKAHYAGAGVAGRIELHAFPGGYCGLSHVEDGLANLCWIGHARHLKDAGGTPEAMLDASLAQNPALAARLRMMRRVSSGFEAISQVSLAPKSAFEQSICMIGDAAGMIAPLCGDGMAMALRSAELATPLADVYLDGRIGAEAFRAGYAARWQKAFAVRLWLGRRVHRAAFRPGAAAAVVRAFRLAPPLGRLVMRQTRG